MENNHVVEAINGNALEQNQQNGDHAVFNGNGDLSMVKESNGDETLIENLGQVDNDATLVTKNTTQGHEESQKN